MLSRSEIIDRLKSFKDIGTNTDTVAYNTHVGLYVVKVHKWAEPTLIIDRIQDNKVIYFDNRASNNNVAAFLEDLAEAYNLNRDFKEPKEYAEGLINILKGQRLENLIKQEVSQ